MTANPIAPETLDRLKAIVGPTGWSDDPQRLAPKLVEWRERWSGSTPILLLPKTTEEVSEIVKVCAETGTHLTPQGGNTGLVGGQIPEGEVLLSTDRLNRVLDINTDDDCITVQAGVTLAAVHEAALSARRRFPLSLASEGSCTIGGNISTNAGGTAVLRFGNMRDLTLGVEAVLPDGRIVHGLKRLRKDNTGYDLKHLLIGAEGTLGVITAATLKLFPLPASRSVAFVGLQSAEMALALLARAKEEAGGSLEAFELIDVLGLQLVIRHIPGSRNPLEGEHPWYVLMEVASEEAGAAERTMERILESALENGLIDDAALAQTETQAKAFWNLRENQSAGQKAEGAAWKHDISVPVSCIPEFLEKAGAAMREFCPGVRIPAFGHVGDGNLHYDLLPPEGVDTKVHMARREEAAAVVNGVVTSLGGSISAEHGIGVMKAKEALLYKDPADVAANRAIRASFDPQRLFNPRVLF